MPRTLLVLATAFVIALPVGCKDDSRNKPAAASQNPSGGNAAAADPADPEVTAWLLELARSHKLQAEQAGDWITFDGTNVAMSASVLGGDDAESKKADETVILQVNFRLRLPGRAGGRPTRGRLGPRARRRDRQRRGEFPARQLPRVPRRVPRPRGRARRNRKSEPSAAAGASSPRAASSPRPSAARAPPRAKPAAAAATPRRRGRTSGGATTSCASSTRPTSPPARTGSTFTTASSTKSRRWKFSSTTGAGPRWKTRCAPPRGHDRGGSQASGSSSSFRTPTIPPVRSGSRRRDREYVPHTVLKVPFV